MKTRLLFADFLLYIGIANATILRCYECSSRLSWHHCDDSLVVKDCPSHEDHCAQFLAQAYNPVSGSSKATYFKDCASKRRCQRTKNSESKTSGARFSFLVFCSSGNRSNGGKLPDLCKPGYYCPNGKTKLSMAIPCRNGTYQPFYGQTSSSSCIQCPNATVLKGEPLTSCLTDRPAFASSSSAKSAGEIVGGVVGPIILLVVAYVVVKKRRCCGYRNVFPGTFNLVYNLRKTEKEQEGDFSDNQLRFSI